MQNYHRAGVSLEAASLFLRGRGKAVYILPSSDPTLALLSVGFTKYDDDDDDLRRSLFSASPSEAHVQYKPPEVRIVFWVFALRRTPQPFF
ncbi:hypothetical protein Hanom_Chr11g01032701 [Helianthus anomalus]